jgi:hypothetical protein
MMLLHITTDLTMSKHATFTAPVAVVEVKEALGGLHAQIKPYYLYRLPQLNLTTSSKLE